MRQLIAALILITAFLPGCASPAVDVAEDDPLIATQEPTSEASATILPSATVPPTETSTPDPQVTPTATPTIDLTATAIQIAHEERIATINAATPASALFSEGWFWQFGDQGYGYVYEGNVCLNTTGTPVYLGPASEYVTMSPPSPNGLYIAYQLVGLDAADPAYTRSEVRIARTDGSQNIIAFTTETVREDYPAAAENFYHVSWMPSSTQLLFSTHATLTGLGWQNADLYRYDATTPEVVALIPPKPPANDEYAYLDYSVSPDGQWIAIYDGNSLGFMRSDGGAYHENVFSYEWVSMECDAMEVPLHPVWEPDSSGVTFTVRGWVPYDPERATHNDPAYSSWYVPVTGEPHKLGEFSEQLWPFGACTTFEATAISPDHRWLGYALYHAGVGAIRVDGSQNVKLMEEVGNVQQFEWRGDMTMRFALGDRSPLNLVNRLYDWRYYTATLDGTVTPIDGPNPPENPLISCEP